MKKELLKKENLLFLGLFILLLFIHIPLITKPILTADVLLNNSYYNGYAWEISLGRFGLYFMGILKGFVSIPSVEIFLSFLLILFITYYLLKLFSIEEKTSKVIVILMMALSPIISATLLFHYCSVPYLLALLCSILSVYFYYEGKNKWTQYVLPVLLIVISLSMYQAYLSLIVTTFILFQLKLLLEKKFYFPKSGYYLLLCFLGIVVYYIGMKLSLFLFHIDMANYSNANHIGFSTLLQFPKKVVESYQLFYQMFFTNQMMKNTYLHNNILYLGIFLIFLISLGIELVKKKIPLLHKVLIVVLVLLMPVFLNSVIFVIADSKLQLLMSASYLVFFLYLISFHYPKILKILLLVLVGILLRNHWIQVQATYQTLEETYASYDTVIRGAITTHMNELEKPFIVIGEIKSTHHELTDKNYGYISDDGIFWEEYNLRKLGFERFCKQTYGLSLTFGSNEEYLSSQENSSSELISEKDGFILINLSSYTN